MMASFSGTDQNAQADDGRQECPRRGFNEAVKRGVFPGILLSDNDAQEFAALPCCAIQDGRELGARLAPSAIFTIEPLS